MVTNTGSVLYRQSLVSQISDALRANIIAGRYELGEELVEAHLAADFEVGRSTVREALRILASEGLLIKDHQSSWQIRNISEKAIWEVALVRGLLEGQAAYLAVQQLMPEDEALLIEITKELEKAAQENDIEAYKQADLQFHQKIVELSHNEIIKECWTPIFAYTRLLMATGKSIRASLETGARNHKHLLEVILKRDPIAAEQTLRNHIFNSYRRPIYDELPDPWPFNEN